MRKIMIVVVARKLAIALWYLEYGLIRRQREKQDDRPTLQVGALGGRMYGRRKPFADLVSPICRCEDEPHPTRSSVHAAAWQAVTELPDIR
jgi:hypothetical protein